MVNQVVFDYLKNNKDKYGFDALKEKLIEAGFLKKDVEEAAKLLIKDKVLEINKAPEVIKKDNLQNKGKDIKWMKIAGFLGIIILVFSLVNLVLVFFGINIQSYLIGSPIIYFISVLLLFLVVLFFLYGFVKLGNYTGSKMLKFSTKPLFGLVIGFFAVFAVLFVISLISGQPFIESGLTGNAVSDLTLTAEGEDLGMASASAGLGALFLIIFVAIILVGIFLIVVQYLFFVGLLKIREQVKFAKITGILGLITLSASLLFSIIVFLIGLGNPLAMIFLIVNPIYWVISAIIGLAGFVVLLFESLVLFDASKKFES